MSKRGERVYRKKGEAGEDEEEKRPRTEGGYRGDRGGGRGRGGRGGGRRDYEFREARDGEEQRGERREGGRGRGRGQTQRFVPKGEGGEEGETRQNEQRQRRPDYRYDKESWYYKYHYGPWPKQERVKVTLETELPKVLPKEERLPEPDKKAFDEKMRAFDADVEKTKEEVAKISKSIKLKAEGGRMAGSNETVHEVLQGLIKTRGGFYDEMEEIKFRLEAIKKELGDKVEEKKTIEKKLDLQCKSAEAINKKIADTENKMQTSTMSMTEENNAIKKMKFLIEKLKFAERYEKLEPRIEKAKIDQTKSELETTCGKKEDFMVKWTRWATRARIESPTRRVSNQSYSTLSMKPRNIKCLQFIQQYQKTR